MDIAANSVSAYGTATTPADGAAIVTIAAGSLPAGRYRIHTQVGYGATAGLIDGMELRAGGTSLTRQLVAPSANAEAWPQWETYRELDGSTALTVNAVGAGPVGSVYRAVIVATRLTL